MTDNKLILDLLNSDTGLNNKQIITMIKNCGTREAISQTLQKIERSGGKEISVSSDNFYKTQAEEALLRLIFIDMLRANLSFPLLDEYLNANLKTASLEDFARYSGYSVSHASRLVKARTGKSFSQLLDEARIDRACALLSDGHTALYAGAETGFATPAGFHRCFLRVKGITPAGYARSVKR